MEVPSTKAATSPRRSCFEPSTHAADARRQREDGRIGRDSYRVYEPARLSGQETDVRNANREAPAAAIRGQRNVPSRGPLGTRREVPTARQAPPITIEARGRM